MTRVSIDGGTLFTKADDSAESSPWLILSNSLATDHTMWDPQVAALRERYRILRYDTRGHGQSDAPPGPYGFDDLVADALAVMAHHGVERASFMGLSLGGMTGLGLALGHPERVERLVCCAARADAPDAFRASWDERLAIVDRGGTEALVGPTLERWLTASFREQHPDETARLGAMIRATSDTGYKGCAAALKTLDYLKDLPHLAVPALYVAGEHDGAAPVAAMQGMADATPGGRLAVVPDAAHIANMNNPDGFMRAIERFLLA